MNRFFSKLDLRDIKIDPSGTRFPPDAEEYEVESEVDHSQAEANHVDDAPIDSTPIAAAPAPADSYWDHDTTSTASSAPIDTPATPEPEVAPVSQPYTNGAANGSHFAEGDLGFDGERSGEVLKVSARSRPSAVAGAIAGVVRESGRAEVQAIGAGATNQAVKAVAIARDYLRETGIEAICLPAFIDVLIDNEDRTAIRLVVEPR
jgi:stage V sporulation protein S